MPIDLKIIHKCTKCSMKCMRKNLNQLMSKISSLKSTSTKYNHLKTLRDSKKKNQVKIKVLFLIRKFFPHLLHLQITQEFIKRRKKSLNQSNQKRKNQKVIIVQVLKRNNQIYQLLIAVLKINVEEEV